MIAGGVLLIVAVVFLGAAAADVSAARASRSWPTTPGRIVRSEVRDNRRANGLPGHRIFVRYEYTIDDEEYEGRDLACGAFPYRSVRSAVSRLTPYPVGASVDVRYLPREPQLSVLEPGISLDVIYLPVAASLLFLGALALVGWGGWRILQGW